METRITLKGIMDASVRRACSETAANFQKLTKKVAKFEKAVAIAAVGMASSLAAGAAATAKGLYDLGASFEASRKTIRLGTGATGEALDRLEKSFENVYGSVTAGKDVVSAAIADINTLTGAEGETLERIARQSLNAASLLGEDAKGLYTEAAHSFNAFGIPLAQMGEKLDYVFKASQSTGESMTDLMKAVAENESTFKTLNYSYEQSIALIGQMRKAGFEDTQAMAALKKALANMAGKGVKDMSKGFENACRNIKTAKDESTALKLAIEAFGSRAGTVMASGIRNGTIAVDDLVATLQQTAETIDFAKADTLMLGDAWAQCRHRLELALKPLAHTVFQQVQDFIPHLERIAAKAIPHVQAGVAMLSVELKSLGNQGKEYVQSIDWGSVRERIASLADTFRQCRDWVERNQGALAALGKALLSVYASIKAVQIATKACAVAQAAWNAALAVILPLTLAWRAFVAVLKGAKIALLAMRAATLAVVNSQIFAKGVTLAFKGAMLAWTVATKAVTAAQWLLNAALLANPVGLVIAGIAALVAAVWLLADNWDKVCDWCKGAWNRFAEAFPETAQALAGCWTATCEGLGRAWEASVNWCKGAWDATCQAWNATCRWFGDTWRATCSWFQTAWTATRDAFTGSWEHIKTVARETIASIMEYIQPLIDAVKSIGDGLSGAWNTVKGSKANPANWFAAGGFTSGPSICGEAGTEAVISFDPAYRRENQGYLMTAAEMLGMTAAPAPASSSQTTYNLGGITFAPVIRTGEKGGGDIAAQLRACMPQLMDMIEEAMAERRAHRYV